MLPVLLLAKEEGEAKWIARYIINVSNCVWVILDTNSLNVNFVNKEWPCTIDDDYGKCMRCKSPITDELHYLCKSCRL